MKEIVCRDGEIVFVDDDMYGELSRLSWYINNGYPYHCIKRIPYAMHKYVLGISRDPSLVIHHKDGNKLNNQRHNLEQVSKKAHAALHGVWNFLPAHLNRKQRLKKQKEAALLVL